MYSYSVTMWILFFFCYAFIGWIWECCYVSFMHTWKQKKLQVVNRGFLHGPVIPIYGFAALSILLVTIPYKENGWAVFFLGALTATVFELVTGTLMEKLFKVKYWDYSDLPLNYHGHICFFVSLFWGFFSVLLVQVIHVPIDGLLGKVPQTVCDGAAVLLAIVFSCDTTVSFNEAMELRDILEALSENNETIRRLERRFDAIVAFTPIPDKEDLLNYKQDIRETVTYHVEKLRWKNNERVEKIRSYILLPNFDELPDRKELLEKLELHRKRLMEKTSRQFLQAANHLKRNPVKSAKYQEIIEQLNSWIKK